MTKGEETAFKVMLSSAYDRNCPLWEIVDEVSQKCGVDREEATDLINSIWQRLTDHKRVRFFRSKELYTNLVPVGREEAQLQGLGRRLGDGPPFYYVDWDYEWN